MTDVQLHNMYFLTGYIIGVVTVILVKIIDKKTELWYLSRARNDIPLIKVIDTATSEMKKQQEDDARKYRTMHDP